MKAEAVMRDAIEPLVELSGVRVRVARRITPAVRKHLLDGTYEWPELAALKVALEPDDVVLELGTGLGVLSTYCARRIGSERVFTCEANPALRPLIEDTYQLNDVRPTLRMGLLTDRTGEVPFHVHKDFWESSTLRDRRRTVKTVTVPTLIFNEEVRRIQPTFLIVDIEGGEYDLSRHMRFHTIRKVLIEIHRAKLGAQKTRYVRSVLYRAGFRVERCLSKLDVLFLNRL